MADINLLQANQPPEKASVRWVRYINIASYVAIAIAIALSGVVFYLTDKSSQQRYALSSTLNDRVSEIKNLKDYQTIIGVQTKVANLNYLLGSHVDWTKVLPKFFGATLSTAKYSRFSAEDVQDHGQASVSGTVGSFVDLDKMIQGFQLDDFNSYIKDVKLVNVGLAEDSAGNPGISFNLLITFNRDLIKFNGPDINPVQVLPANQPVPPTQTK